MIKVIIWIAFGIACYFLAEKKNRNKGLAFAMGLLFGFFALIYYLVVKKVEKKNETTK